MSEYKNILRAEPYICAALSGFISLGGVVDPERVAEASIRVGLAVADKLVAREGAAAHEVAMPEPAEPANGSPNSPEVSASPPPSGASSGPPEHGAGQSTESSAPPVAPEVKPTPDPTTQIVNSPPPGKGGTHQGRPR